MADFIDSRALNNRAWEKRANLLVVFIVLVTQFFHAHSGNL
ncbi:MAG TPA: hypothetical protein VKT33_04040 [Candidatus Angelobacter sp.]|nr:hypothetical protein [Candidatus Angelobacter sp.]